MADTSTLPAKGNRAPVFALESNEGTKVKSAELKGNAYVVYFYPKDMTPGCTTEAQEFRDLMGHFEKLGIAVFGVSPDGVESHCKFIEKQQLNFALLVDADHALAEKYGLWVEKSMYGRKYWGVQRATFLVDSDGKIAQVWPKVKPKGHAAEVLTAAKALG